MSLACSVSGANITWVGGDTNWDDATSNWSPSQFPVAGDYVVVDNGATVTINSSEVLQELGVGWKVGTLNFGAGGRGKIIQTSGLLQACLNQNTGRAHLGSGTNVGIYVLQDGSMWGGIGLDIGYNNAAASNWPGNVNPLADTSASGFFQNGGSTTNKGCIICSTGDGAKGFFEMNAGTCIIYQDFLRIADASVATGQKGIFSQNGGTSIVRRVWMGASTGSGGSAVIRLNGGLFYSEGELDGWTFTQPAGTGGVYVDIAGGTLRVDNADNTDGASNSRDGVGVQGSTWTLSDLKAYANSDWRSMGRPAAENNLVFTLNGTYTDITITPLSGGTLFLSR